jgi:hypothetical protein
MLSLALLGSAPNGTAQTRPAGAEVTQVAVYEIAPVQQNRLSVKLRTFRTRLPRLGDPARHI